MSVAIGVFVAIGGLLFAIFNKPLAKASDASTRVLFGKEPAGAEPKLFSRLMFAFIGTIISVFSILGLVGVLPTGN